MAQSMVSPPPASGATAAILDVPLLAAPAAHSSSGERDGTNEISTAFQLQVEHGDEEVRSQHSERSERSERGERQESIAQPEEEDGQSSPRSALASYTERLNTARVRAEFESSLLVVLTLNVLYTYYVDHKLIVLFVRASQVVRLLYYPYASEAAQRGTALLVLISNVAVLFIHTAMMAQHEDPGRMLFINFIGPEPKSNAKIIFLDILIILLQSVLMQCRLEPNERLFLTKAPVPIQRSPARNENESDDLPMVDPEREYDDQNVAPT